MIIAIRDALDGRSFPEAGDYVYNLIFRRCFLMCA